MPILAFLSSLFQPAADIIKGYQASDEQKQQIQAQMAQLQNQIALKMLEYESQLLAARADVIKAEANGNSLIQRIWRPTTMMVLLVLVVCDSFGWLHNPLSHDAWLLIQVGMGGYIGSRSVEKIVPSIASAIKDQKSG